MYDQNRISHHIIEDQTEGGRVVAIVIFMLFCVNRFSQEREIVQSIQDYVSRYFYIRVCHVIIRRSQSSSLYRNINVTIRLIYADWVTNTIITITIGRYLILYTGLIMRIIYLTLKIRRKLTLEHNSLNVIFF